MLKRERQQGSSNVGRHFYYYADGRRVGDVSTDPSDNPRVSYAEQLARKNDAPVDRRTLYRTFRPVTSADFDQSYEPINEGYPGAAAGSYTVRGGETLQAIAQALWGDKSLWYLIAEVNGLRGDEALTAGQVLSIPNKVANVHNNAGTFRPYSAGEAIGSIDPTLPPAPPPPQRDKGCGGIGQIIAIVIAVVVTVVTGGAAAAALTTTFGSVGGAAIGYGLGAAVGSIASQGFSIAAGMQDSFSWKAVGQAALGGAITGGITAAANAGGALSFLKGDGALVAAGRAALGSGISMALQGDWNWTAVVASALGGGASGAVASSALGTALGDFGSKLVSGFADGVAGGLAAGEKLRYDSVFIGTLGGVIGSTIGEALRPQNTAQQSFRQSEIKQQNAEVNLPVAGSGLQLTGNRADGLSFSAAAEDEWSRRVDRGIERAATWLPSDPTADPLGLAALQARVEQARLGPAVMLASAEGGVPGLSAEWGADNGQGSFTSSVREFNRNLSAQKQGVLDYIVDNRLGGASYVLADLMLPGSLTEGLLLAGGPLVGKVAGAGLSLLNKVPVLGAEVGSVIGSATRSIGDYASVRLGALADEYMARTGAVAYAVPPRRALVLGDGEASFLLDDATGQVLRAQGTISGPHSGRSKGYLPEPLGGRLPGEHRGHLIPEGSVDNPRLVNRAENLISEAPGSNLGLKKSFDLQASRFTADNHQSLVTFIAEPQYRLGTSRPFAVSYTVNRDGVPVLGLSIFNR